MKLRFILALLVSFGINVFTGAASAAPDRAAPTPPARTAGTYQSLYSHAAGYTDIVTSWPATGNGGGTCSDITTYGDKFKKINLAFTSGTSYVTATLNSNIDPAATGYTDLSFDIWVESNTGTGTLQFRTYSPTLSNTSFEYIIDTSKLKPGWNTVKVSLSKMYGEKKIQYFRFLKYTNGTAEIYIDNIYLYKADDNVPKEEAVAPPVFSTVWGADKVMSIFSGAYPSQASFTTFNPAKAEYLIDDNPAAAVWRFNNTADASMSGTIDVTGMNRFHMDIWTKEAKNFRIRLNGSTMYPSPESYYTTAGDKWLPVDVELPQGTTQINSIEIVGGSGSTVYFADNVYFYSDAVSVTETPIKEANKALGRGMNLGNAFEDNGYGASGNSFSLDIAKDLIDKIAAINEVAASGSKFDHVRIPVRWDLWGTDDKGNTVTGGRPYRTDINAPYAIDPGFMADVKTIVDYTLAKGLKVVLNVHHYNTLYADFDGQKPRFLAIWKQLADQFKFYDHNLYFEMLNEPRTPGSGADRMTDEDWIGLIPETLPVMRKGGANTTRPILIATFDWGGFPRLERLVLPENDQHLIATVHLYNPGYICSQRDIGSSGYNTNIEWWDTQIERDMVLSSLAAAERFQERYPEVPIHVGEFGSYKRTETDSRSLWIAYLRDAFEKRGYSHAYWEFRAGYGIYHSGSYNRPVVDALLSNDVPKKPAGHTLQRVGNAVYDLNVHTNSGWTNQESGIPNELVKTFTYSIWGPTRKNLPLAKDRDAVYRISFKASASKEDFAFAATTSAGEKAGELIFYPGAEEKEYSFILSLRQNTANIEFSIQLLSTLPGSSNPVTLVIKDFLIEEIEKRHEAAPLPALPAAEVTTIFSTHYPGSKALSFSGAATQSYIKDNRSETGNEIIQAAGFTNQTITFAAENVGTRKTLHLNAYAGSQINGLTVKVSGNGGSASRTFDLPSHTWQHLGIDLGALTTIQSIELSGGTGDGRKLFLDHIYLQSGSVPENLEEIPAAPVPDQTKIVNLYSTKYGTGNAFNYSDAANQSTAVDTNGNNVLRFSNFTTQLMEYAANENQLDLDGKNRFSISFYPEERFEFAVRLVYYKDGTNNPATNIVYEAAPPAYYKPGEWNTIDVNIEDFAAQSGGRISAVEFISSEEPGSSYTVYLDHLYFYYRQIKDEDDPEIPAYLPPAINNPDNLISIFSNYYPAAAVPAFSDQPSTITVMGDDIWRFKNTTGFSVLFDGNLDAAAMTHLHIDIYTKTADAVDISILIGETAGSVAKNSLNSGWLRLDIPLSEFNIADLSAVSAVKLSGTAAQNFYIDNLYFYNDEKPFDASPAAEVNAALGRGINLGGMADRAGTGWNMDEMKSYIDKIYGAGSRGNAFGHLRLPAGWTINNRSLPAAPHNIAPQFIADSIKPVVDYALEKGFKVVLTLSDNSVVSAQAADYFRYYPESLLFETGSAGQAETLAAVRASGPGRTVMFRQDLSDLSGVPQTDGHIIVSAPYLYSGEAVWNDTQEERAAVNSALSGLGGLSVPVNIGAFGTDNSMDMDSRARWTTYTARLFESGGCSWAYWNFSGSYGIYNDVEDVFHEPLVDALLHNAMPPAAVIGQSGSIQIYDSSTDAGFAGEWEIYSFQAEEVLTADNEKKELAIKFDNGYYPHEAGLQLYYKQQFSFEKDAEYLISFTAGSTSDNYSYNVCLGSYDPDFPAYKHKFTFTPEAGEKTYTYSFTAGENFDAQLFFTLGGNEDFETVDLMFKDIRIEKAGTASITAAPAQPGSAVKSIFSSQYGNISGIDFPAGAQSTTAADESDEDGNELKLFTGFDYQDLTWGSALTITDESVLHISAYPGSVLHLTVEAVHGSVAQAGTITLQPHTWNELEIDLKDFFSQTGGAVSTLRFSGGTGAGRMLYLDHIYFSNEAAPASLPADPVHLPADVISLFGDSYLPLAGLAYTPGASTRMNMFALPLHGKTNLLAKLNSFGGLEITRGNGALLDLPRMENFHMDAWTMEPMNIKFTISWEEGEASVTKSLAASAEWQAVNIGLALEGLAEHLHEIKSIRISNLSEAGTLYLDNVLFYRTPLAGPDAPADDPVHDSEDIQPVYGHNAPAGVTQAGEGAATAGEYAIPNSAETCLRTAKFGGVVFSKAEGTFDLRTMENAAFAAWSTNVQSVDIIITWGNGEQDKAAVTKTLQPSEAWQYIDIPLSLFSGLEGEQQVQSITIRNSDPAAEGTLYIDNLHFYKQHRVLPVIVAGSNGADSRYASLSDAFAKIAETSQTGHTIVIDVLDNITETNSFAIEAPAGPWDGLTLKGADSGKTITLDGITLTIAAQAVLDNLQLDAAAAAVKYSDTADAIAENTFAGGSISSLIIAAPKVTVLQSRINIAGGLLITSGSCLNIPAEKAVAVAGITDNQAGESGLIIGAEADKANAAFIFANSPADPVQATVEMHSKAFRGSDNKYKWQHIGIPVRELRAASAFAGSGVRQWNESGTTSGTGSSSYWIDLGNDSPMHQFYGYEITQHAAKKITFRGELVNSTFSKVLSYTDAAGTAYPGQHVIGNSYTAAAPIDKINFGEGLDKTIYLYNTGSFDDWTSGINPESGGTTGTNPGQYLAVPQEVMGSDEFIQTIPSMQGYLVRVEDKTKDCTLTVNYADVAASSDKQRAARIDEKAFVFSRIEVEGERFADCMWLFTEEHSSKGFDNGWDGRKFFGSAEVPQIWAREGGADYQINTVPDIQNTVICFKPGTDGGEYTLRFRHHNMDEKYESAALHDIKTGTTVDVTADGAEYRFTSESTDNEERFLIVSKLTGGGATGEKEIYIYSQNNNIFVLNPYNASGVMSLYDVSGRKITTAMLTADSLSVIPVSTPAAVYIIHVQVDGCPSTAYKVVTK